MYKIITPQSLESSEPTAQLVKLAHAGLVGDDLKLFQKRGAAVDLLKQAAQLRDKVASDETLIHLIAMGSTESTGPNRNGDGFRAAVLRQYYPTFEKYAHFYRDHLNTDPRKSYGRVVTAAYNEPMQRVELLVALSNNKAAADRNKGLVADKELAKLASGQPLSVSMACITDPTSLVCTSNGYKQICDIVPGDLVPTHMGRWRRVTELRRRRYTGEIVTVQVSGLPVPLKLTADHPMYGKILHEYAARGANNKRPTAVWSEEVAAGAAPYSWIPIGDMDKSDRLDCRPLSRIPGIAGITDTRIAAILGTYVAEGCISFCQDRPTSVLYTIHADDWAVRGIPAIIDELWEGVTTQLVPRKNSKVAFSLHVHSAELARWCFKLHGQGAASKTIPAEMFNGSREAKLEFMGRWLDGDGWCDLKGAHWSSCNLPLILQGRDMLLSLGIAASIYKIDHSKCATSGYENSGIEYTLNVSNMDQAELAAHSMKIGYSPYRQDGKLRQNPGCVRPIGDSFAYCIRSITREQAIDIETWNFEVEEDHSYSLFGTTSHNCSVGYDLCSYCGNKAPTVKDYCRGTYEGGHCKAGGLRHNIGALVEIDNGLHHLHADNPHPRFFDISHVGRNADRIAYVTGQLKSASARGSDIIKSAEIAAALCMRAPLELQQDSMLSKVAAAQLSCLYMLADQESLADRGQYSIPRTYSLAFSDSVQGGNTPLPQLGDFRYKVASTMRALADARVLLPISRFIELFTATSIEKTAELTTLTQLAVPGTYTKLTQSDDCETKLHNNPYLPAKTAAITERAWAQQLVPTYSVRELDVQNRVRRASLHSDTEPGFILADDVSVKTAAANEAVAALAEQYCLYKLAFLQAIPETELPLTAALTIMQNYIA